LMMGTSTPSPLLMPTPSQTVAVGHATPRSWAPEGTISADAKIAGTFGAPRIEATLTVVKGALAGEPFDRFSGTLDYSGTTLELANAHLAADSKNMTVQARYQHHAGDFGSGQLSFQVDSNAMPLDRFQLVSKAYPGIGGTAELHGSGAVDITPAKPGQPAFHLIRLNATLAGRGLRLNDQTVRDGTLTATTKGSELTAHFDSELSAIRSGWPQRGNCTCASTWADTLPVIGRLWNVSYRVISSAPRSLRIQRRNASFTAGNSGA